MTEESRRMRRIKKLLAEVVELTRPPKLVVRRCDLLAETGCCARCGERPLDQAKVTAFVNKVIEREGNGEVLRVLGGGGVAVSRVYLHQLRSGKRKWRWEQVERVIGAFGVEVGGGE